MAGAPVQNKADHVPWTKEIILDAEVGHKHDLLILFSSPVPSLLHDQTVICTNHHHSPACYSILRCAVSFRNNIDPLYIHRLVIQDIPIQIIAMQSIGATSVLIFYTKHDINSHLIVVVLYSFKGLLRLYWSSLRN